MIAIELNKGQIARLENAVRAAGKSMAKELAGAINATSKKTSLGMGRQIRETVSLKKDESESTITIQLQATPNSLQAIVSLLKSPRLGLRHFGARQDKSGVSYKIGKKGGRSRVNGAFMGPKPGAVKMSWRGNVFKRAGKNRLPIVQLKGVSPWGAYTKNDLTAPQAIAVAAELDHQIQRRINLNVLRANGLVKT